MSELAESTGLPAATLAAPQGPQLDQRMTPFGRSVVRSPWLRFAAVRLLSLVGMLLFLAISSFSMVRLIPGDPGFLALGSYGMQATPEEIASVNHRLGVDQPYLTQLRKQFVGFLHGDLGTSFGSQEPVADILARDIPHTLVLAGLAVLIVLGISLPGGVIAAALTHGDRHRAFEVTFTGVTSVVGSIPEFLTATFLAFMFAVTLQWFPVAGGEGFSSLVLPVLALSIAPIGAILRIVRVETLNVLSQEYVKTARSKRLPVGRMYLKHVLPNVVTAALTIGGIFFASLIAGAVVVENVFALPGLGTTLIQAVVQRDYPVIQGCVLLLGTIVIIVNAIVDLLASLVNPGSLAGSS